MVNYRIFCVSDDLFSGFETRVDLDEVANVDEIVKEVIEQLLKVLYDNKLDILLTSLELQFPVTAVS